VAHSGASTRARLPVALDNILRARELSAPDRPPFTCTSSPQKKYRLLKESLIKVLAWAGSTYLDTCWCSPAFVSIASNWFPRGEARGRRDMRRSARNRACNTAKSTGIR
jgi:hypothetical protein